jgi:hypothetical protein
MVSLDAFKKWGPVSFPTPKKEASKILHRRATRMRLALHMLPKRARCTGSERIESHILMRDSKKLRAPTLRRDIVNDMLGSRHLDVVNSTTLRNM